MRLLNFLVVSAVLLIISACGGGGGGGSSTTTVTGVAAVGAPIDGTVSLKDSTGQTKQTTTNATTGEFSIDVSGLTPPFILRAQKSNGDFLYSSSISSGIANINPLSSLVMASASISIGAGNDPNALYQAFSTYASKVTQSQLDKSTATIYGKLSTGFKAKMGNTDSSPIYSSYSIGNALDKAFDEIGIVYDIESGYFSEKSLTNLKFEMFGSLGKIKNIGFISGNYVGEIVVGSNTRSLIANVWSDGEVTVYIENEYVYYGKLIQSGSQASGTGVMYKLDANGLSSFTAQTANTTTLSANVVSDKLQITFSETFSTSPSSITLSPTVNGTYGNNLNGSVKSKKYSTLGPFAVGDGVGTKSGTDTSSSELYFKDDTLTGYCDASHTWSFQLSDLEQSIYYVTLKEAVTSRYTWTACTSPYLGQSYDTVGGAIFSQIGLLTFLVDKATKDNTNHEYSFVAVKLFTI